MFFQQILKNIIVLGIKEKWSICLENNRGIPIFATKVNPKKQIL
jgi:hypothetical protein